MLLVAVSLEGVCANIASKKLAEGAFGSPEMDQIAQLTQQLTRMSTSQPSNRWTARWKTRLLESSSCIEHLIIARQIKSDSKKHLSATVRSVRVSPISSAELAASSLFRFVANPSLRAHSSIIPSFMLLNTSTSSWARRMAILTVYTNCHMKTRALRPRKRRNS